MDHPVVQWAVLKKIKNSAECRNVCKSGVELIRYFTNAEKL